MPNPLSKVNSNASVCIGNAGDRPLTRHPQLAIKTVEAIGSWANVESFMLQLFVEMMGGQTTAASNMYLALGSNGPKRDAINAVADTTLGPDSCDRKILRELIKCSKSNQSDRDKIAHGTWGDSPDLTNALLLVDPRRMLGGGIDYEKIFVYKEEDFNRMIDQNDYLCKQLMHLRFILQGHPANSNNELTDKLSKELNVH